MTREQFINEIAKYVQKYAPQYGIKVYSPIIAQAVLESASGTSELAVNANNFFGLKYKSGRCPSASGVYYKVGSEQNADGSYTSSAMQWCKFNSIEMCVKGYFEFISHSRYSNLKGVTDPKKYLELIKSDGYATSLNYVDNVYKVVKTNNLTRFDIKEEEKMVYTIAIDAGHGSATAGKRTPDGYLEHWINVKCAYYFDIAMKRCGFETVRIAWDDTNATDDIDIALAKRQQLINVADCDASVSWHANAHGDGKTYTSGQGIETLIHNQASKVGDSLALANAVQSYLIKGTSQKNRGVKTSNLAMCNCIAMGVKAAILIEVGFMTNEYEKELLKTDAFCLECAEEAAMGVCKYFGVDYKANTTSGSTVVVPSVSTNTSTIYRVRKSWDNTSSQLGAFSSLDKAKAVCKSGYYVFDGNGKIVYPVTNNTSSTYTHKDFVKEVQVAIGAKVDGIAGKETLSKTVTISKTKNNKHAVVKPIQKYLNSIGFEAGNPDSIFGTKTHNAVAAWQKKNGLVADGIVGINTWKKLFGK